MTTAAAALVFGLFVFDVVAVFVWALLRLAAWLRRRRPRRPFSLAAPTFAAYEEAIHAFMRYPDAASGSIGAVVYTTIGLVEEAGEVAGKLKKLIRDKGGDVADKTFRAAVAAELGDVLWYLTRVAAETGSSLEGVVRGNLDKLNGRLQRGTLQGSGDAR